MSYNHGPKIVTNGLICYLDSTNTKSYPGSGTTWYDLTKNGNHGTITSGEFATEGAIGYLRNSGNTSNFFYISLADSTSISASFSVPIGGWTIEEIIWTNSVTYPEADAGGVASVAAYGGSAPGFDWNHGITNTDFKFGQANNSGGSYSDAVSFSVGSPYNSLNAWRVRTMTWNRTNNSNSLYVNGVYINSVSTPNSANTSVYDGGGIVFGTLYGWKHYGRRAGIKIYNRVLSADEIKRNHNVAKTKFGLS
jgi:hypothetical protein